jgi:hypothetical protein
VNEMPQFAKQALRREVLAELRAVIDSLGQGGQHVILLNDYQVTNLRSLLHAIGYASVHRSSPLNVCDTGDWVGELYQKLPHVALAPNVEPGELARRASEWARANTPPEVEGR